MQPHGMATHLFILSESLCNHSAENECLMKILLYKKLCTLVVSGSYSSIIINFTHMYPYTSLCSNTDIQNHNTRSGEKLHKYNTNTTLATIFVRSSLISLIMMTSSNGSISAWLTPCAGNSPVTGEFPSQGPVTRSFNVFLSTPEQTIE